MMTEMLRPCPYCGGKATVRCAWGRNLIGTPCFVATAECECLDRYTEMYSRNREEAILLACRKWNGRET